MDCFQSWSEKHATWWVCTQWKVSCTVSFTINGFSSLNVLGRASTQLFDSIFKKEFNYLTPFT